MPSERKFCLSSSEGLFLKIYKALQNQGAEKQRNMLYLHVA